MDHFWKSMGWRVMISSSKIMKKDIFLSFWSIINRGCDRIDFFLINYWHNRRCIWKSWKKMTWEHSVFDRMNVFWQNMDLRAVSSLKNRRITNINWVWEQLFFSKKSGKKGILLTFMAHKIVSFWQNIRFLTKYEARWETPGYPHNFLW